MCDGVGGKGEIEGVEAVVHVCHRCGKWEVSSRVFVGLWQCTGGSRDGV